MTMRSPDREGTGFFPMDWSEISEMLDRAGRRDARYQAARWALDTLQERLGNDWLERAAKLSDGEIPLSLHLLGAHTHALAEALEWALRLEMSEGWDGSADFLRDLLQDPRPARILHSRAQLAQASLAARLGWPVSLEPSGDDGAPADLAIVAPSGTIIAEVRVLTPSDFGRDQREIAERVSDWLFWLGVNSNVWIGGEIARDPTMAERREIEEFVERQADQARKGKKPIYSDNGIALELHERGAGGPPLTSPPVQEDLFNRMVRVIAEKAEKMQGSGAQWLHATVLTGLWAFTQWGRSSLSSKAPAMSAMLRAALGDRCPGGIVLTSAPGLAPDDKGEEIARDPAGISLRIGTQALRARESLILPFHQKTDQAANDLLVLARAERDWLGWALAERNLPPLSKILRL